MAKDGKRKSDSVAYGLMAAGGLLPAIMGLVHGGRARKAMRLRLADAVKSTADVDKAIARHVSNTGAKLPAFSWGNGSTNIPDSKYVTIFTRPKDYLDAFARKGFKNIPASDMETMHYRPYGKTGVVYADTLSPKTIMHELGHAADHRNGMMPGGARKKAPSIPELLTTYLFRPENTEIMKAEIRAWNNAGIPKDDAIRMAALSTYSIALRRRAVNGVVAPALVGAGLGKNIVDSY